LLSKPWGTPLGLLIGKQIGIFGLAYLAVKAGLAKLPEGIGRWQLHGGSLLAAIGFTISSLIDGLASPARGRSVQLSWAYSAGH
jgi:NhaA family Na+:H+ antiporter